MCIYFYFYFYIIIQFLLANRFFCLFCWFEIDVTKLVLSASIEIYNVDYLNCLCVCFLVRRRRFVHLTEHLWQFFPEMYQFDIHTVIVLIVFVCGWKFVAQTVSTMTHETIQVHCKFQWVLLCYRMNVCFPYDIYVINYIIQFMRIEVYKFLSPVKVKSLTPFFRTHKIRCKACKFGHVRCFSFFFHSVVMFSLFQHSSE